MKNLKNIITLFTIVLFSTSTNAQVFSESFEGSTMPAGWTQEQIGTTAIWYQASGGPFMGSAQHGTKLAGYWGDAGLATRLVTPPIDLTTPGDDTLAFYYALRAGAALDLFYKTTVGGSWVPITATITATTSWALVNVYLPNPSATYYIAFKGTSIGSDDMVIDNLKIINTLTTGVKTINDEAELTIYPNPGMNELNVQINTSENNDLELEIINMVGELMTTHSIYSNNLIRINTSNFSSGIYFIKIRSKEKVTTKKWIKSKD